MKRIAAFFISFVLILSMFSGMAVAKEQSVTDPVITGEADIPDPAPIVIETESITPDAADVIDQGADDIAPEDPEDTPNNDDLLMEYMELSVSDSNEPTDSVFGLNHLTGINVRVYELIKDCVSKVASGEESSTVFTFYMSDLGLDGRYSAADLGVSAVVSNGSVTSEAKAAMNAMLEEINLSRVNTALQFDCPAEFYWYEKSVGCRMQSNNAKVATYDSSLGEYVMYFQDSAKVQFSYTVAEDYAVNHASNTYVVDSSVIASIQTAISHANDIIEMHAAETDYQKLVSYKEEICSAVKYNTDAGNHNYTYGYGNPWQLIWVFDDDSTTNVVCEGYAKAFQFLCDGSAFRSKKVESRIVTGTMAGGTGAGGHMWNIVTMNDGQNYLVDVTNCDGGTIGAPDKLFLVGYRSGSVTTQYSIAIPGQSTMTFTYDDSTRSNYSEDELTIASNNYDSSYVPVESFTITFKDADGTILLERIYEYGTAAADIDRPADPEKDPVTDGHYVFSGWTPEIAPVSADAVYTAEYALQPHQPGEPEIKNRVEATCEDDGSYEEVSYCTVCGMKTGSEVKTIPATGHSWGEWYVITPATEEAEGLEGRDCLHDPSHTETRVIPKLAHMHDLIKTDAKEATCMAEGNSLYWTCTDCGKHFADEAGTEEIEKDSWIIPKKEHTAVVIPGKDATCTESGLTEGSKCSVCGEILHAQEVIPAIGHSYGDWIVTKAATCTEEGQREKVCSECGDKVSETIHAKGHSYGEWLVTKEATYEEEGQREKVCSICGDKIIGSIPKRIPTNGWAKIFGKWYYYENSTAKTGWLKDREKWYYLIPSDGGAMATGLCKVGSTNYYMDENGVMLTGWIDDDGTWYYAQESGALATGWLQSGNTWYYMKPDTCAMATGWVKDGDTWYYMSTSGAMVTGWVKDGSTWYYMSTSGAMVTGWVKVGSSWYYMKADGTMAAGEWCDGYWLNANGTWIYQPRGSWKSNSTGWWFGDTSGWYAKNETVKIDGVKYTFDANGYWVKEEAAVENQ